MGTLPQSDFKYLFDLRSDLLAPPAEPIVRAIAEAAPMQGEMAWRGDPLEQSLEYKVSRLLGKPAAALFPTCTAANIAGLVALGANRRPLIMEAACHLMTNEMAGLKWLVQPRVLDFKYDGIPADLPNVCDARDAILCLENTHMRLGGLPITAEYTQAMSASAKSLGWKVFLDGSRLWNAAVALGETPATLAASVDLLSVSFNKGLGAPNGAALVGSEDLVEAAATAWRSIGGILRPAHLVAAGALAALGEIDRLAEDHRLAKETAAAIAGVPGFKVTEPRTNIVMASGQALGLDGRALATALRDCGLGCLPFGQDVRLLFHRGIPAGSAGEIAEIFQKVSRGLEQQNLREFG